MGRKDGQNNNDNKPGREEAKDVKYGQHENYDWYMGCKSRERNKHLFTANRLTQTTTRQTAIHTRQNDNANRHGFECAEERDYYPYWHPTPWRDIAVLTDNPSRCRYYQEQSQNVRNRGYCEVRYTADQVLTPATADAPAIEVKKGEKFQCEKHAFCRDGQYNQQNVAERNRPGLPNNRAACQDWHKKVAGEEGKLTLMSLRLG